MQISAPRANLVSMVSGKETAKEKESVEETGELKVYEVGYIFVPLIAEENLAAEVAGVQEVIEKHGGMRISDEFPVMKTLAYPMRKNRGGSYEKFESGYFGWIKFEMPGGNTEVLKNDLEKHPALVRFLLVRTVRDNVLFAAKSPLAAKAPVFSSVTEGMLHDETSSPEKTETVISDEELDRSLKELIAE